MGKLEPRVDAYIDRAAPFAQPVLRHLRALVHEVCPHAEEIIKWGFPHFDYLGPFCSMAAFKGHCAFTLWKGQLLFAEAEAEAKTGAMGQFGKLTKVQDLPSKRSMTGYLRKAMKLNEAGIKTPRAPGSQSELVVPAELTAALRRDARARNCFATLSPGHRREYAEWIAEAKRPETRAKRVATAVEWLAEGKRRNWKYEQR